MVFNTTFNNISAVLSEERRWTTEQYRNIIKGPLKTEIVITCIQQVRVEQILLHFWFQTAQK